MDTVKTNEDVAHNVAANLRKAITDRGWTVAQFIDKTGIPQNTVYRYLRGENEPSITHLSAIRGVLEDRLRPDGQRPKPARLPRFADDLAVIATNGMHTIAFEPEGAIQ